MVIGVSPCDTAQVSWAKAPESTTEENENGAILGGSRTETILKQKYFQCLRCDQCFTIDPKSCRVGDRSSRISGPASVLADVGEVHTGDDQHTGSPAKLGGADARTGVQLFAFQAPCYGYGHVAT